MAEEMATASMDNWDMDRVQALIKERAEESLYLEFKAAGSLINTDFAKNELSKDVSAFANADGGTIVYGITGTGSPTKAETLDPVNALTVSAEWLEQVINSRIQPRIPGIRIHPLRPDKTDTGKAIFVVEIPSGTRPYQASDKRYYRRYNFEARPMDNYEIEELRNRSTGPVLDVGIGTPMSAINISREGRDLSLSVTITNTGENVAKGVYFELWVPNEHYSTPSYAPSGTWRMEQEGTNLWRVMQYHHRFQTPLPIYPGIAIEVFDGNTCYQHLRITAEQLIKRDTCELRWKTYADSMLPRSGALSIKGLFFND